MKSMTAHLSTPANVKTLGDLMSAEIGDNKSALPRYADWSEDDKRVVCLILDGEKDVIKKLAGLSSSADSVKGEDAMKIVYPSANQKKATDAVTKLLNGVLVLSEAKYLMRFGGKGPFGGVGSFRDRVSGKFLEMTRAMVPDGESLSPLRVIVVSDRQLPLSINHVKALLDRKEPDGAYSEDGRAYDYVICSSRSLRMLVDNPHIDRVSTDDYFFFTL